MRDAGLANQLRPKTTHSGVLARSWLLAIFALASSLGCQAPWNLGKSELDFAAATPYPNAQQSSPRSPARSSAESGPSSLGEVGSQLAQTPQASATPSAADGQSFAELRQPQPKPLPFTATNMRGRIADSPSDPPANPQDVANLPEPKSSNKQAQPAVAETVTTPQAEALRAAAQQATQQQTLQQMAALLNKFQSQTTPGAAPTLVPPLSPPFAALAASASLPPAAAQQTSTPVPPATPATPSPAGSLQAWREICQQASTALEEEVRQRKKEGAAATDLIEMQQKLRLLYLTTDRPDLAAAGIDELSPAERKSFQDVAFALSTWLSPQESRHLNLKGAKVLRSLREASDGLAAVSKLDLKNLSFCEKVEGFGWYTQFSRYEFTPKQEVLLYLELENFSAEEKSARQFETELQGSYQIFDSAGAIVDQRQLPLDRETCRNLRRDYFIAYRIFLPEQLAAGRYRLELTVEDLKAKAAYHGRKLGEGMIEFTIRN